MSRPLKKGILWGKVEVLGLRDDDLVSLLSGTKMMRHIFSPWIYIDHGEV